MTASERDNGEGDWKNEEDSKGLTVMGCRKGKNEHKPKPGRFACKRCGAVSKNKGHLCKPNKIKA